MPKPTPEELAELGPTWGLYLIPRKLAPAVGFIITKDKRARGRWRAFNLRRRVLQVDPEVPTGTPDFGDPDIDRLLDTMGETVFEAERERAERAIGGSTLGDVAHFLESLEVMQVRMKKQIDDGIGQLDPRLYEVEHLIRMAIPLLRGAKAKLDPTQP